MAEPYEVLSTLYDVAGWGSFAERMADRVLSLAAEHGLGEIRHVVDVACGTGIAAAEFAQTGYRVTGVDRSPHMLAQARKRIDELGLQGVTLVEADMRDLVLDEPADLVTCMYDSLNYLVREDDLAAAFRCAAAALHDGGLYVFDMNTIFGLAELWGTCDQIQCDTDDWFIVSRTRWDHERSTNTLVFHGFIRRGRLPVVGAASLAVEPPVVSVAPLTVEPWERFRETHVQRGYPVAKIRGLLEQVGLAVLAVYDARTDGLAEPGPETARVLVVARKPG